MTRNNVQSFPFFIIQFRTPNWIFQDIWSPSRSPPSWIWLYTDCTLTMMIPVLANHRLSSLLVYLSAPIKVMLPPNLFMIVYTCSSDASFYSFNFVIITLFSGKHSSRMRRQRFERRRLSRLMLGNASPPWPGRAWPDGIVIVVFLIKRLVDNNILCRD